VWESKAAAVYERLDKFVSAFQFRLLTPERSSLAQAKIVVRRENCKFAGMRKVVQAGLKARLYERRCSLSERRRSGESLDSPSLNAHLPDYCGSFNASNSPLYVPPLIATTTYCRPLSMYVIGEPVCGAGM